MNECLYDAFPLVDCWGKISLEQVDNERRKGRGGG